MSEEKYRILLADDEALTRLDLKEMLYEMGHQVVGEARNGLEALELAEKLRPDLVIMDVRMPRLDGVKAAKLINGRKLAPVLLLTAYSDTDIIRRSVEAGVMGYLTKPVLERDLSPAVRVAVQRSRELGKLKRYKVVLQENLQQERQQRLRRAGKALS
ncbi:MAG: response regulator [Desulfurispora sp.]|uniref:response regulator n=1 Tax=Desulfurispora sp. TaxID=3014275 RepID=UPI00404B6518